MSDLAVVLRPGLLPLSQARWARESSLVADAGVPTVRRGRPRVSVADLTAVRVHQATLLVLAVALVVPMLVATPVTGAISGLAAELLVARRRRVRTDGAAR